MRHLLRPARRDQRHQPETDRDGDDAEVVAVAVEIDSRQDAYPGGGDHAEHHQPGAAEHELRHRFDQRAHLGQQPEADHDQPGGHADPAAFHAGHADQPDVLAEAGVGEGVEDAADQRAQTVGAQAG